MYNSLIGMYIIYPQLFENLELPESVDKETAINNILLQCGEFEVLYAAPHFLSNMIGVWSKCKKYQFDTLVATTNLKYNPIENSDRYEDFEETTRNQSSGSSTAKGTSAGNNEKSVAGFESGRYVGSEKNSSDDESSSSSSAENSGNSNTTHSSHVHGTIGVITSQDMIKKEREIAVFSIYDAIAEEFKREFCIMVY